jgi:hypothetical protein
MKLISFILLTFIASWADGQNEPEICQTNGVAIDGYDPVAFFTLGQPKKAKGEITYDWKSATWRFESNENRDLFIANPEKYAPQYGGYCAWGMREGYKAETRPKNAWTFHDGKLYLNYNKAVTDGWLPEKEKNIEIANNNWAEMTHQ